MNPQDVSFHMVPPQIYDATSKFREIDKIQKNAKFCEFSLPPPPIHVGGRRSDNFDATDLGHSSF